MIMGYIGKRMSENAFDAYSRGLLPMSKFTKKILEKNGWMLSVSFFHWLCKKGYIYPLEFHHTTPFAQLTPFYKVSTIQYIIKHYDLKSLYDIYLNKCTIKDVLSKKGVKYVKILTGRSLMHTKSDVYLDCVEYNGLYWWSKVKCFETNSKNILLIKTYNEGDLKEWRNPNRKKIERQICMRKSFYRSTNSFE